MPKSSTMKMEKRDLQAEGNSIKQRRVDLGMSQGDLAEALGVTSTTVSRWERGTVPVASWLMLDKALRYEEMSKIGKITTTP